MSVSNALETTSNLFDYFHDKVGDVHADTGRELHPDTLLYLARLLAERARADRPTPPEQTLAELHARAAHAPPGEQIRSYRELGDRALVALGCFRESLEGRIVGPNYYADMGAAAYWKVDRTVERWFAAAFGPVFRELATCFEDCVELLGLVRERHSEEHPDTLLRLYTRWTETGSELAARRLAIHGVLVGPSTAS